MSQLTPTAFDFAALAVIGLSVLVAFLRGFLRETLTIATWVGAGVAAYFAFPYARELARRTIETEWLADAAALCIVFVVPLIAFKVAAAAVADHIPGGMLGTIDRVVGLAFGAARGAVVVCVAYLGLVVLIAPEDQPEWVKDALILPYVKDGAALLTRLIPADVGDPGAMASTRLPHAALPVLGPAAGSTP
jgi:membrane protein required for colicin V production